MVNYTVPGLIVPVQQPSGMSCWAAMFTMMYSWKNQVSIEIETAVATLGPSYVKCFRDNTGLPIEANRQLAADAGMVAEPLMGPSIDGWAGLLMNHGLLWTSYGWLSMTPDGLTVQSAGRHIIIFYGIEGDGTADGTQIKYVDPSDGAAHTMSVTRMVQQHETGFTLQPLTDRQLGQFSQIMHY
jgi:hypothetical protein